MYPFHMPGHKRNLESTPLKGAFRCDITEIDGFDNLHDESGIILEAQERANSLYGAGRTFFLVNGSTSGVLSAVSAVSKKGGTILAARGSHRSFYHGAYLRQLNIENLPLKMMDRYGIFDSYASKDIEKALKEISDKPVAVFITSPTYEGKCSDVKGMADVCHQHGIPLIVDAAHGAHFGLDERLPQNAISQGADIVIHSLHKTLPSMTQTGLIHVQGELIDPELVKRFLRIYQSSSPSYILMSSIDLCIGHMADHKKEYADKLIEYRREIQEGTKDLKALKVVDCSVLEDPAKVLIYTGDGAMTGQQLYDILREDYSLQLEMAGEKYALAIITGWDTKEGISRLIKALCQIDEKLPSRSEESDLSEGEANEKVSYMIPRKALPLYKAWDEEKELVALSQASGRISRDFVNLYPPGIPIITPGEVISPSIIEDISRYMEKGLNIQGVLEVENRENKGIIDKRGILCVKQR